jgi:hypothetical protein
MTNKQTYQDIYDALRAVFDNRAPFDTTRVIWAAEKNAQLAAAIEANVPHAKYRSGYWRGRYRHKPLLRLLKQMARQRRFETDEVGFWMIGNAS